MGIVQPGKTWLCRTCRALGFQGWVLTATLVTCNRVGLKGYFGAGEGLESDDRNRHSHAACEILKNNELWFSLLALCAGGKEPVQIFLH